MGITYNGTNSDTYNVTVEKCPSYPVAQRVVEHIRIDGRNGDLIRDTGAYANVDQVYSIWFDGRTSSMQDVAHSVALWLNGSHGYCRLEDTYDPNVYRLAVMSEYTEYKNFRNRIGRADVTFSCKPQRFLKSGENFVAITGATLANSYMDCYPVYAFQGNGNVSINGSVITITDNPGEIYIDSETQDCWAGSSDPDVTQSYSFSLTTAEPTSSPLMRTYFMPLTNYFLEYHFQAWDGRADGILTLAGGTTSSNTITVSPSTQVTVSHTANVISNSFTLDSGTMCGVTAVIHSRLNCNECVTGDIVGVPHNGCSFSKDGTITSAKWQPRYWTL